MERPTVSLVLLVVLCVTATLPGPTMGQAEGTTAPDEDFNTTTATTTAPTTASTMSKGQGNHCLLRREDLINAQLKNEIDTRLNERDSPLNELDTRVTNQWSGVDTRLNDLGNRQTEIDTRFNGMDTRLIRMDSRLDGIETTIADMKEYLIQRLDAMEVKTELALAGSKHKDLVRRTEQTNNPTTVKPNNQLTTPAPLPKDCREVYTMGNTTSGVYRIAPEPNTTFDVYCDQELDDGGWIVFQQRKDGTVDFYRDWNAYKDGFGPLTGEFWLGNTKIHLLTKHQDQQLKVEITSPDDEVKYADYFYFSIEDEAQHYRLNVARYSGGTPPGDSLAYHNGLPFSTRDADHDTASYSCATSYRGAWWYWECHSSNLNGQYGGPGVKSLVWYRWNNDYMSMKGTRMMMRRRACM